MTVGIYKIREEAEEVVKRLRAIGISAEVLSICKRDIEGTTYSWHVIVPRDEAVNLAEAGSRPSA